MTDHTSIHFYENLFQRSGSRPCERKKKKKREKKARTVEFFWQMFLTGTIIYILRDLILHPGRRDNGLTDDISLHWSRFLHIKYKQFCCRCTIESFLKINFCVTSGYFIVYEIQIAKETFTAVKKKGKLLTSGECTYHNLAPPLVKNK